MRTAHAAQDSNQLISGTPALKGGPTGNPGNHSS